MAELTMPRLSDTMEEGTIGRWLKKPGDHVEKGEILLEIETDKATMELESYESGTIQQILVNEGQTVPIGKPIAIIGAGAPVAAPTPQGQPASEEGGAQAVGRTTQPDSGGSVAGTPETVPAGGGTGAAPAGGTTGTAQGYNYPATETARPPSGTERQNGGRVMASPVARRLAEEHGIDLGQIHGTGPGGRVIKENVEAFIQQRGAAPAAAPAPAAAAPATPAAPPAPAAPAPAAPPQPVAPAPTPPGEITPLSRMRRAIARAMSTAKPGIPHIYVTVEIDMAAAMQLRQQINDSGAAAVKISVNDMVVKAAARALAKFPVVNSSFATAPDGSPGVILHPKINVSVAVALDDGLTAPVINNADQKSLGAIAAEIRNLAGRARENKLKQNELEGATFQVTNLGMFGVVDFDSIITSPQAASLAVGAVREVAVVRDGQIVPGQMMNATLSADHRIIDGAVAAQYLQEIKRLLEAPMSVLV